MRNLSVNLTSPEFAEQVSSAMLIYIQLPLFLKYRKIIKKYFLGGYSSGFVSYLYGAFDMQRKLISAYSSKALK